MSTTPTATTNIVHNWDDHHLVTGDPEAVIEWADGAARLDRGELFWNVTVGADRAPHARPVFAVVAERRLYTTSARAAAKTSALEAGRPCCFATSTDGVDVVYEGVPRRVADDDELALVADRYRDKYGWPVEIVDGAFDAPFGAPTAGTPPYHVFAIEPVTVYGFGTVDDLYLRSTRWDFAPPSVG